MSVDTANVTNLIVEKVINFLTSIKNWIIGFHESFVEARRLQANFKVAEMLHQTEYRNRSFHEVLHAINTGKLDDLHK